MVLDCTRGDLPMQETSAEPAMWEFRDGQLVASDWTFWADDREEMDEALQRLGFPEHPSIELGAPFDAVSVSLYQRLLGRNGWPEYLGEVSVSDRISLVALDSLPNLLDFLNYVAPVVECLARLADRGERIREELETGHRAR